MDIGETASEIIDGARALATGAIEEVKRLAASEQGERVRHQIATGLMIAVPVVVSLPVVRRTRIGKWIELAGGTALVVTVAEKIRDWKPDEASA